MLGPLLFVRVLSNIFCFTKKIITVKEIPKKSFHKKKILLNVNLKNVVKQKDAQGPYLLAQTKFQLEKNQNWRFGIHIEKIAFIHFRDPKKRFFFQFRILRSVSTCSLFLLQTLVKCDSISVHPTLQPVMWIRMSLIRIRILDRNREKKRILHRIRILFLCKVAMILADVLLPGSGRLWVHITAINEINPGVY